MPAPTPTVFLLMVAVAVVGSNALALSPILADVARDLGASPVAVARANAAYGGATALSALLLGRLVDRLGAERVLVLGLAALSLAMLASAFATHWAGLALAQGAAGLAAGVVLPASYALATAVAPEGRGAETLGRVLNGWAISLVAGVPLSAVIAALLSWRASYVLFAAVLVPAALLLARLPAQAGRDVPPVTLRGAVGAPGVLHLLATCLLFMAGFYGVYAYLGDAVRGALELSAVAAGLIVLAYGVGFGLAALGDPLIDRWGPSRLLAPALGAVALVHVGLAPARASFPAVLLLAGAWGFANHVALNILVLRLARAAPEGRGAVLALNSATTYAGALIGTAGGGLLYERAGFGAVTMAAAAGTGVAAVLAARMRQGASPTFDPASHSGRSA